jgi:hypothetical protein
MNLQSLVFETMSDAELQSEQSRLHSLSVRYGNEAAEIGTELFKRSILAFEELDKKETP